MLCVLLANRQLSLHCAFTQLGEYDPTGLICLYNGVDVQTPCDLPEEARFEEYLATEFPEDDVRETFIDPLSLKGAPKAMSRDYPDEVCPQL